MTGRLRKGGFRIKGFINQYPDFIVATDSGKIIILETKGDGQDNSDSVRKLKLADALMLFISGCRSALPFH